MSVFVGVDVGGTFTDLVSIDEGGRLEARKVLSTPGDQSEGVQSSLEGIDGRNVRRFVHGTTVATNMLLERAGARVVLCATAGFTDILRLRRQDRVSLYDLSADHPAPLVSADDVVGVRERVAPEGIVYALSEDEAARTACAAAERRPEIVAISLLHAYANSAHEQRLEEVVRRTLPDTDVVVSSAVFPEIREYERTTTTVAEAYLRPGVGRYIDRLAQRLDVLGFPAPAVMTSSGGMRTAFDATHGAVQLALSGPAGGVVGAAAVLRAAAAALGGSVDHALTIDIGGTSADVGLIVDGAPLVEPGGSVAGVPIALPRVLVETVSAGGGSLGWIDDGGALRVGPRSAGAVPGPAAFRRGGTLPTVTDAHVVLGNISTVHLSGSVTLDAAAARTAILALADHLGRGTTPERIAEAMIATADAAMARALRRVSVERGVDPRVCILVAFGGGGPLHACGLAERIGVTRIFVPPHAGVLSALGLALAAERREAMTSVMRDASGMTDLELRGVLQSLEARVPSERGWKRSWWLRARYSGQGHELDVDVRPEEGVHTVRHRFASIHARRFGFELARPLEIVSARHVASGEERPLTLFRRGRSSWNDKRRADDGGELSAELIGRTSVALGDATMLVARGWVARSLSVGGWLLERTDAPAGEP